MYLNVSLAWCIYSVINLRVEILKPSKLMREHMNLKSYDNRFFKTKMMAQLDQACANDSATRAVKEFNKRLRFLSFCRYISAARPY